jgi:hypothetical protein
MWTSENRPKYNRDKLRYPVAPCVERYRALASPSPLLAPVMTTTFPSMLLLMNSLQRAVC